MVGSLSLPHVCEGDPLDVMSCGADRGLDSPDSGLPPSPSPSAWLLPGTVERAGVQGSEHEGRVPIVAAGPLQQLHPLSFGEGISLDPLPSKEIRYISSVHYDSERHFIQAVTLRPSSQALQHCRQTVVAVPHSTWRHYKTQLDLEPRQRPQHFQSTTIIYPKKSSAVFTTELSYDSHRLARRRFLSSVELQLVDPRELPQ